MNVKIKTEVNRIPGRCDAFSRGKQIQKRENEITKANLPIDSSDLDLTYALTIIESS